MYWTLTVVILLFIPNIILNQQHSQNFANKNKDSKNSDKKDYKCVVNINPKKVKSGANGDLKSCIPLQGPYRYEIIKYETCKGPKRGECGTVKITDTRNMSNVPYVLDFSEDCPVTKARITIGTIQKDNKTKTMWNYQLNKPCHHFVLGPLITKLFNLTQNCIIEKGHYEVNINMNELSTNFIGSYFFYDTYFFKTVAHNNDKNFFCVYSVIKIYKS